MSKLNLNRALVLETQARASDGAGGFNRTWVPLGTLWAAIRPRSGRLSSDGEAVSVSVAGFQIVVRGAPVGSPRRPQAGQRFRMGTRVFQILAVTENEPDIKHLLCECREEVVT